MTLKALLVATILASTIILSNGCQTQLPPTTPHSKVRPVNFTDIVGKNIDSTVLVQLTVNGSIGPAGTGVVIRNEHGTFVWTANHVISMAVIPPPGAEVSIVVVKKTFREDGDQTFTDSYKAADVTVIAASAKYDLAVLRINDDQAKRFPAGSAKMYSGKLPREGTDVFHVGCHGGSNGMNIVTEGIISRYFTSADGMFMNSTTWAVPGSSGGGLYLSENGECVGLITAIYYNIAIVVPYKTMEVFAKEADIKYALQ